VFICKLRKKLANAPQGKNYREPRVRNETVWGRGYMLRELLDKEAKISA
jgi:two-component system, cell cycle response regulator CtrA